MREDIVELTVPTRGSFRFGYLLEAHNRLMLMMGPVPELYPVLDIPPKGNRKDISRSYMKAVAKKAHRITEGIYALPTETRPKTYPELVDLIAQLLTDELLMEELGY